MKRPILLCIVFLSFCVPKLYAQDYKTSAGLRIGPFYGVTVKHFTTQTQAWEAIIATRRRGLGITGLYEIHTPAFAIKRLNAYGGIGAHVNIYDRFDSNFWDWDDDDRARDGIDLGNDQRMSIGVDMILGIEYTLTELPFNIGLDWKPALNLIGDYGLSADQFALSFRFVFK